MYHLHFIPNLFDKQIIERMNELKKNIIQHILCSTNEIVFPITALTVHCYETFTTYSIISKHLSSWPGWHIGSITVHILVNYFI